DALAARAKAAGERVAATGTLAVSDLAPVTPTRLAIVYAQDAQAMLEALDLRPAERGANVLLVEPRDAWVFQGTRRVDGLTVVAVSQACADLLTSPGRGPAEGLALLDWMQANETAWRG
ncbi:MAG TPA: hypothetical protein VJP77_03470, partial [Planctomycetota bacterium]|nr:hypothetical protein [Planctomycetota bacterium]